MIEQLLHLKYLLFTPEGLEVLISTYGLPLLVIIVFAETGLFIGFFLPGDSLLFIAGFMCGFNRLGVDFITLNVCLMTAAICGNMIGYWFGLYAGHALYERKDGFFFRKKHLHQAKEFYEKHGGGAIILSRFVPIVRTFAPIVAGVAEMNYRKFFAYNALGGIGWVLLMTSLGYKLGKLEWVAKNLEKAVLAVIVISVMPILIGYFRKKKV